MMNNKLYALRSLLLYAVTLALTLFSCKSFRTTDILKEGFLNPPDSSRPGVYWYIMDGNLDKKAITGDLESMKSAGIGYALFLEVNVGIPRGKIEFMGDEWQELFTWAVREAERLGIKIILGSGPGWAGSGGPWVKPEQSMMHLVAYDTMLSGPSVVSAALPKPRPEKPFFGESSLTPELREKRDKWYEDVRVLAFPAPEKSIFLDDLNEKAFFIRPPYTSQAGVKPFIPMKSDMKEDQAAAIKKERIIDITNSLDSSGKISWIVPPGKWIILRLGKTNNGAVTRPAPSPGLGFESDKFDTVSLKAHFDAYTGKLINRVRPGRNPSGGGWKMIHIDSWEMGAQNWTNNFMEQFIKRRGYDPLLYLPVLKGYIVNSQAESERFLWDIRQTASELIVENHAGYFRQLGKRNGMTLSIEPYDMNPSADLDLGAVADIPTGEFWSSGYGFNSSYSCIEATSTAHVTGKQIVAAEAFTADGNEAWKKYPGNMKNQTDWALAAGINRFIFHTFAHKSFLEQFRPGMTMGPYGVHWDRGQTWWPMVSAYHKYLSRSQFLLSQGRPVSDILYLTPEGAPMVFRPPSSAMDGTDTMPDRKSYSFDGCSPEYLINHAYSQESKLTFPGGASYRVLVLPDVPLMTPELLGKLDMLLKGGIAVIGFPPSGSPSLSNYPVCDETVRKLAESIWSTGAVVTNAEFPIKRHGNGLVIKPGEKSKEIGKNPYDIYPSYETTEKVLRYLKVKQDFISHGSFRYTHRRLTDKDIYFVSNRTENAVSDSCTFRDGSLNAELWDPVTGEIRLVNGISMNDQGFKIKVTLEAYQSIFLVFSHIHEMQKSVAIKKNSFPVLKKLYSVGSNWKVNFDPSMGGPATVVFDSLIDWTARKEEGIKYYSGIAHYNCMFSMPENVNIREGKELYLDLGKVKNIARVKLNGKDLGIVWISPFRVKVDGVIRKKKNQLEIDVANLWINRLIGDESRPWDGIEGDRWPDWLIKNAPRTSGRYTFTTYHFYHRNDPLSESGLIGPVTLLESE